MNVGTAPLGQAGFSCNFRKLGAVRRVTGKVHREVIFVKIQTLLNVSFVSNSLRFVKKYMNVEIAPSG